MNEIESQFERGVTGCAIAAIILVAAIAYGVVRMLS